MYEIFIVLMLCFYEWWRTSAH